MVLGVLCLASLGAVSHAMARRRTSAKQAGPAPSHRSPGTWIAYASLVGLVAVSGSVLTKLFFSRTALAPAAAPLWSIVDIPGKAKGVVAQRNIPAGTLLLQESPLLRLPDTVPASDTARAVYLTDLVDALAPENQAVFFSLANTTAFKLAHIANPSREEVVHNIYHTNTILAPPAGSALFPTTARINHACAPNADYTFRADLQQMTVLATREIQAGEEVQISYFDAEGRTRRERIEYLHGAYGFTCTCSACSAKGTQLSESDFRRTGIKEARARVREWSEGVREDTDATLADVEAILHLMEAEAYHSR